MKRLLFSVCALVSGVGLVFPSMAFSNPRDDCVPIVIVGATDYAIHDADLAAMISMKMRTANREDPVILPEYDGDGRARISFKDSIAGKIGPSGLQWGAGNIDRNSAFHKS